jgi:hypothetical protein
MDGPAVKGVLVQGAVERIESYLDAGKLSREELELRLGQEDLGLFEKGAVVAGLWYRTPRYERLLDLIYEVEGRRTAALVAFGRRSAERMLENPAFAAIFETIERRNGGRSAGPLLVRLAEVVLNFTRWQYVGETLDDFAVEVSEAGDYHEHARFAVQGMIEFFGSHLFGRQLCVKSERPSRERIVFRAKATHPRAPGA